MTIENPCKSICTTHKETGLCIGCYRTYFERGGHWSTMTDAKKEATLQLIAIRKEKFGELELVL